MNGTISLHCVCLFIHRKLQRILFSWVKMNIQMKCQRSNATLASCLTEYVERSCASYDWFENLGYALHSYGYYVFFIRFIKIIIQNLWSLMNFWRVGWVKSREMAAILFSHSHKIQFIHKNKIWRNGWICTLIGIYCI